MCKVNRVFDEYYFALYTLNDELITVVEDVETLSKVFDKDLKEVLKNLRNHRNFVLDSKIIKVFVYKKEKNIESRGKRK